MRNASLHPFAQMQEEMERFFGDLGGQPYPAPLSVVTGTRGFPALNVWESGHDLMVEAELPGLSQDDLEILVVGNQLTLRGQRKPSAEENATYHRRERGVGKFERIVRLPVDVDADQVQAQLVDGVLRLTLPKSEAVRPRKIAVKTG